MSWPSSIEWSRAVMAGAVWDVVIDGMSLAANYRAQFTGSSRPFADRAEASSAFATHNARLQGVIAEESGDPR